MRLHKLLAFALVAVAAPLAARAQNITTVVGGGPVNLPKRNTSLGGPAGVKLDSQGNAYFIDNAFSRLLRVDHTTGNVSVVAGTGVSGYNGPDVLAIDAQMNEPSGLCIDANDNVFIADSDNNIMREYVIATKHLVDVVGAQTVNNPTFGGDGGPVLSANLHFPDGCSFDSRGNLYIADRGNNEVRVAILGTPFKTFTPAGDIYEFAGGTNGNSGTGTPPTPGVGASNTAAIGAALDGPFDVFVDNNDNVYVATVNNPGNADPMLVRVIPFATAGGKTADFIYTVAGGGGGTAGASNVAATSVPLNAPEALSVDANGNLIFAEAGAFIIREVAGATPPAGMTTGNIYTIAGNGSHGYSGDGGVAVSAGFASPAGTFVDATGNVYIADSSAGVVRFVDASTSTDFTLRTISTYAGNGHVSYADATSPTAGELFQPAGLATSTNGDLVIADTGSSLLRGVPAGFTGLTTVAGKPEFNGFGGDAGPANQSVVNGPLNLAIDGNNNGYIADTENCIVRQIDGSGNINTIAGTLPTPLADPEFHTPNCGFGGASGLALSALFGKINGIAVDSHGNVFFSDETNNIVWELVAVGGPGQTVGNVYVVAGTQTTTGSFGGDTGVAAAAQLNKPTGLFIDSFDNLFIADTSNHVIREVPSTTANGMTKGHIYTVAGTGTSAGFSGDGADAIAAKLDSPFGIFVDPNGNLFIADTNNHVIRVVPADNAGGKTAGFIYTVAGTPQAAQFDGDGGAATSAHLSHPKGLAQGPNNSLLIADSDNNRIRSVSNLTSNPSLTLSNYSLDFPNQPLLLPSTSQPIIINNADNISLTLTTAAITGTNAADFAVTANCDAVVLAAGGSCTVHVTFTPSLATAESALLTVSDTNGDNRTVDLTGTSVPAVPGAQASPTTLTFAAQVVNTQSAGQNVTLTNNGTGKLNGIVISITTPGANASDFSQTTTCGANLNVGANCTITVKFKPTDTGARAATLQITDNATTSPQTVALTGTAVAPGAQLSGTTLTFADQTIATTSASQSIVLTNNGTLALTITTIAVSGTNAADFAETDNCAKTPATIAVNATCTINVTFTPAAAGTRSATVTITDDANPTTQTIALSGKGIVSAPTITLNPTSLTFSDQLQGATSAAQTVTVTNGGNAPLTVTKVTASAGFAETDTCTAAAVAPTKTCTISVTFAPTATGPVTGSITLTDNAAGTQIVALTGTGYSVTLAAASGGFTSATVKAGQAAIYNLQFAAPGATSPVNVSVACTDPASKSTCNAPASVTLTPGTPSAYAVTVSTTAASMMAPQSEPNSAPPVNLPLAQLTAIALLFCLATMLTAAKSPAFRTRAIRLTITACLVLMPIAAGSMLTGCASSGGSSTTPPPVPGTPAGTYMIKITPTVGGVAQAATTLTLIVQ